MKKAGVSRYKERSARVPAFRKRRLSELSFDHQAVGQYQAKERDSRDVVISPSRTRDLAGLFLKAKSIPGRNFLFPYLKRSKEKHVVFTVWQRIYAYRLFNQKATWFLQD